MIEAIIETKVPADRVWQLWRKIHAMDAGFSKGQKGTLTTAEGSHFSYKIQNVEEGKSFSILWKSLFVKLIFTHSLYPQPKGCKILYTVQIRGFFAWPVRFFLGGKIQSNLEYVLKSLVKELESGG